jgi:hypothetical protein
MPTPDDAPDIPSQDPTGELPPGVTEADVPALQELKAAGWGEGDTDDPHLPEGLLELGEAIQAHEAGLL